MRHSDTIKIIFLIFLFAGVLPATGQTTGAIPNDSAPKSKSELRQMRRDSIRAHKNVWISVLGGPSYTPEAKFGVGGAMLASFRLNKADTVSQRSFLPIGFNLSLNGTIVIAGTGTFFLNENRFRMYFKYNYRDEPANYYGKGYDYIESNSIPASCGKSNDTSMWAHWRTSITRSPRTSIP